MTDRETKQIVAVITVTYPNHYKNINPIQLDAMVNLWKRIFADRPYQDISNALDTFIATDTKGFPPMPGNINQMILDMQEAANTNEQITENDAWNLVYKATCNSTYHSREEFAKLPPIVQQAVGSPENLKVMAMSDEFNQSVESSNFKRIYRTVVEREKNRNKIPKKILNAIGTAEGYKPKYLPEQKQEVKQIETEYMPENSPEQLNNLINRLAGKLGGD